jgi:phage terminase large subunit GpA-like protein
MSEFTQALTDACRAWLAMMPPNRMSVSQGAAKNLVIKRPGGASGNWNPRETPYMVEPMDMLASRAHNAVVFVGGAQTGKTVGLCDGWLAHVAINDPGDMAIFQMTQDKAREFKRQRLDRAFRNSPALRAIKTAQSRDDNLHDMLLRNGMMVRIAWPTVTNMSSSSYRYTMGTDYDRWPGDIDGEGDGFTLMGKRVTTFLSRGMVAVESSPGYPATDPTWKPATPHEAPPVGTGESGSGVLGIYNRSDRRRFYWKCVHCAEWFEAKPGLGLLNLPPEEELLEGIRDLDIDTFARQHARVICPHNGCILKPSTREVMNLAALEGRGGWLADGLSADSRDRISGTPRTSSIAGYWLGGVAATYVSWESLIRKQMQALLEYELTGSELPLQTTANTDQAVPYMSRLLAQAAKANSQGRIVEQDQQRYLVPDEAVMVIAVVDVQTGTDARFEVQVHAVGAHREQWVIDRYSIRLSERDDAVGDGKAPLDPAGYSEDWDILTSKIVKATYRTNHPDREMRVLRTFVDSGDGNVTEKAYQWYRRVRSAGLAKRVRVSKGVGTKVEWHVKETMVGGRAGYGDIPLQLYDPNKFKDMVAAGLSRRSPGPGYYHFPAPRSPSNPAGWVTQAFFDELKAEVRQENGTWSQVKKRNETLDLCCMVHVALTDLGVDRRGFWDRPPSWALPHDENSEIITPGARREEKAQTAAPQAAERRIRRSAYMG